MSGRGLAEKEWRKISNVAGDVDRIRAKYDRLLELLVKEAGEQAAYVADLSAVDDPDSKTAVIKSFAGDAHVCLAWCAEKEELEGVMAVTIPKRDRGEVEDGLKVYIPSTGAPYLVLGDGQQLQGNPARLNDFAYVCLMTIVRKLVDLSTKF